MKEGTSNIEQATPNDERDAHWGRVLGMERQRTAEAQAARKKWAGEWVEAMLERGWLEEALAAQIHALTDLRNSYDFLYECANRGEARIKELEGLNRQGAEKERTPVGRWTAVTEEMPDDEITVLVWDTALGDAALAYHDSEVLSRRSDSGWMMAGVGPHKRVLIGVTHWCGDIRPPTS